MPTTFSLSSKACEEATTRLSRFLPPPAVGPVRVKTGERLHVRRGGGSKNRRQPHGRIGGMGALREFCEGEFRRK